MQFKELYADDRAVSPVIGVILMVAITVILAAVIGTFVLGLGSSVQKTTPQAQFGFEWDSSNTELTVTHESGETVKAADLKLKWGSNSGTWNEMASGSVTDVSAGTSVVLGDASGSPDTDGTGMPGTTVRVIWESPEGDNTATLADFDVPS